MHSFDYELEDGKKFVVHYDGDGTGRAIWTVVKDHERIVETEADIEYVQNVIMSANAILVSVMINGIVFPLEAVATAIEGIAIDRIMPALEDKLYDLSIRQQLKLENNINSL